MFNNVAVARKPEVSKQSAKALQTQQKILKVAYDLFVRLGYDETTMRHIAKESGIVAGAIYHYFPSKEHIGHAFYEMTHWEHLAACQEILQNQKKLTKRFQLVLNKKIEIAQPYRKLSQALFRVASNPHSPLSPFSEDSRALRSKSIELFQKVVFEAQDSLSQSLKTLLPEYLWLAQMGIILHWIYDESSGAQKTFWLIEKSSNTIESLLKMMKNPLLRPFQRKMIGMLKSFKPDFTNFQRSPAASLPQRSGAKPSR